MPGYAGSSPAMQNNKSCSLNEQSAGIIKRTMNKFERLKKELEAQGHGKMKAFGNSMLPILKSGSLLSFEQAADYKIGDIVFCKVKGRYIDAHKIVKTDSNKGFLIANNHGYENGWTKIIYGRVITGAFNNKVIFERKT